MRNSPGEMEFPWQELWKLRSEAIDLKERNQKMLTTLKNVCRFCRQPEWASEECNDCYVYTAILMAEKPNLLE